MTEIDGAVYLAKSDTGHFKIGVSKYPVERVKHFNTIMPVEVEIIHYFPCDDCRAAEAMLHEFNKIYRVKGEWFELPDERVWIIMTTIGYFDGCPVHDMTLVNMLLEASRQQKAITNYMEQHSR